LRAVLTSFGSTGDIQPLLALAKELHGRGHHPVLAVSPNFAGRARDLGLEFVPLGPKLEFADIRRVITTQTKAPNPIEQARHYLSVVAPAIPRMFQELCDICHDADLLVSTPYQLASRMVYEATGIPLVSILLSHFAVRGSKGIREMSAPMINPYREQEGLKPLNDPLGADAISPLLALFAISRHMLRRSERWPEHHHVTGYFFLEEEQWSPPPDLVEFVASDEPLLVVTLGSMVHDDPEKLTDVVLESIKPIRCRAIIQRGWSNLATGKLPGNVWAAGFAPHSWLLPRASCVVHHGGGGTMAATIRAGVPAVIIPHTLDQPIWAEFARALGCAGAVIPYSRLTSQGLRTAIAETMASSKVRQAVAELGKKIRAERGVQVAAQLIEQLVSCQGRRIDRAART
jgi:sterol 3beta-glucosyltransferase